MRGNGRGRLAREVRETVPRAPGVYAFLDAHGQLLYVGKSVNLRRRVGSYFAPDPLTIEPHLGRLVSSIRGFAWWQTQSELLALLLEDAMIKEQLPPLNTRQREFAENRYLELTEDEFPACLIVEHADDFRSRDVFGPLKDEYYAATLRAILHEALGIRTCGEPEPVRRCLDHDIGRCSGPCRGAVEPGEYRERVALARGFLRGSGEKLLERLVAARDGAAAAKRYEEAGRLQDAIDTCRRYEAQQRFADRFMAGESRLHCPADGIEYRFENGALVAPRVVVVARGQSKHGLTWNAPGFDPEAAGRHAAAALRESPSADRRFLTDRTRIVCSWVRRQGDDCRIRLDRPEDPALDEERRWCTWCRSTLTGEVLRVLIDSRIRRTDQDDEEQQGGPEE